MIRIEFKNGEWEVTFPNNDRSWYPGTMSEMDARTKAREEWLAQRD